MKTRFSAFRRIRVSRKPLEVFQHDASLFPIRIAADVQNESIAQLAIPSLLKNKFNQNAITRLGQLDGMTPEQLLSLRGFGPTCLKVLSQMLIVLRDGKLSKLPATEYKTLSKLEFTPDVLAFQFDKINMPTLFKSQLRGQFHIQTVSDFIGAFESGELSKRYVGSKIFSQVWPEIALLVERGTSTYLKEVSLDSRTFLEIVQIIKNKLSQREHLIFQHRLCPIQCEVLTRDELGKELGLTRERIRQIETRLVKQFQIGKLREIGWLIRRKTLEIFTPPVSQLGFHELLNSVFFAGVQWRDSSVPAPIVFLDRVFYPTFTIDKSSVSLNKTIQRQRNFT